MNRRAVASCLALGLTSLILSACTRQDSAARKEAEAARPAAPASQPLPGGDQRAWLSYLGDHADRNHCRARLVLPLAGQPVWETSYTSAQFSSWPPSAVLHYDGTVVVGSLCSQLMLIDTNTWEIDNRDVYLRDETRSFNSQELFENFYIAPTGRLLAGDSDGRYSCFDLPGLTRLWVKAEGSSFGGSGPIVADQGAAYASWGLPRTRHYHAVELEGGATRWTYPFAAADAEGMGITLGSGVLVCYARPNQLRAVDAQTGKSMWAAAARGEIELAPVGEERGRIYALLRNESLECRDLLDGRLLWSFSWEDLLPSAERERRAEQTGLAERLGRAGVRNGYTGYALGPDASYLALLSGHVLKLSPDGVVEWITELGTSSTGLVLFDNALLVSQLYMRPDFELQVEGERAEPMLADAFNLTRPDWQLPRYGARRPDSERNPVRHQRWTRVVALSPESGAILSSVETEVTVSSNLCPAGSRVLFGGPRAGSGLRPSEHYITAYDWVEP